jgi:hypothetical protein
MAEYRNISDLERRADHLLAWLEGYAPDSLIEKKHLAEGSSERAYWHYGYMVAVRDVLRFLTDSECSKSQRRMLAFSGDVEPTSLGVPGNETS